MAQNSAVAERRSSIRFPQGDAPLIIRFEGIRYEVISWFEVGDYADGMVEATMRIPDARYTYRVETIEQTW